MSFQDIKQLHTSCFKFPIAIVATLPWNDSHWTSSSKIHAAKKNFFSNSKKNECATCKIKQKNVKK
jgi:hypothetical protein